MPATRGGTGTGSVTMPATRGGTVPVTSTRPRTAPTTVPTAGAGTVSTAGAAARPLPTGGITMTTVATGRTGTLAPTGARPVLTTVT